MKGCANQKLRKLEEQHVGNQLALSRGPVWSFWFLSEMNTQKSLVVNVLDC